ncbi:hypothetical protein LUZ63_000216 [Rhynchospora breviuscula]|uniref:Ionotropic glutamate receptor C-terminal domain-containing protein n=1 Tax=Rhynchospora breviuscula TaxID=2022672 RepID=A0A9Q0HVV2_9POAL|nr:hypothetical protein LUZ63_000216 [Rhynchospora breviuscula]
MNVKIDPETNATRASGYSVDVFEAAVKRLPYAVSYKYELFGGNSVDSSLTYNDLIYQVYLGKYDVVIGDITIRYNQEKLESILSKIVVIVWVFVLLVLTSSYTASLTSMLTVQNLQPTVTDIRDLKKTGEFVGYKRGPFVEGLLQELNFDSSRMRGYYPEEFSEALDKGSANGGVAAIVHEIPYIKLFLAKNCKSYTMVGPIYKTAGFGFAFPKGSPLVPDISRAILNITDGDDIIQLENKWIGDEKCLNNGGITVESNSLNFLTFWGLFLITGAVSTICLLIFAVISFYKKWKKEVKVMSLATSSDEINIIKELPTLIQGEDQVYAVGLASAENDRDTSPTTDRIV